ncbi:unnamed protein product [Amoebophrya sp. A25]|nr:unnamed protein product [Amoebophrya sp. A25]|eukprot:GSA25T00026297001.1
MEERRTDLRSNGDNRFEIDVLVDMMSHCDDGTYADHIRSKYLHIIHCTTTN